MLPSDIGPYRIHERLGAGGMGEVYRAYDRRLERWVAIKVVRPDEGEDPDHRAASLERFRREARAVAGLSHPGVVQIHDILTREEGDCIVMELVEGETLGQVIHRGRLPLGRVVPLGREIAEALAAAHAKGVIHRDLKAENVMITADGHAKILDFGLAKRFGPETHDATLSVHGKILGTSHAMSPEQAQGLPVDHRSDLFSLGTLLYELATGQAPFRREALAQTLTWVCTRNPTPAHRVDPEVPQLLSQLIDHLLEKNPEHRPQSAGQVAEVLRHLEHTLASPTGTDTAPSAYSGQLSGRPSDGAASAANTEPTLLALPRPAYGADSAATAGTVPPGATAAPAWTGASNRVASGRRWPRWLLASIVVGALIAAGVVFFANADAATVYVAVPAPTVTADDHVSSKDLLPSAVRVALLQELLSLQGVTALAPDQVDAAQGGSSVDLARALAADEVIMTRLDCHGSSCRTTMNRIRGTDGALLWTQIFDVPSDDLLGLSHGLGDRIRQAYADRGLRSSGGSDRLDVAGADYEEYLRIREAFRTRLEGADLGELLDRTAAVRRSSPRFVPAYLLEAQIALDRFRQESRDKRDLNRAFDAIHQARQLSPSDPSPLFTLFDTALVADRLDLAEQAAEELEKLEPGNAEVQTRRAMLVQKEGRPDRALELLRDAVARRPSEGNLGRLAQMELQHGDMNAARSTLETLLDRAPDSRYGRGMLAQLELMSGKPERAVELYEQISELSPGPVAWTNLGVAYLLQKRYDEAVEVFLEALQKEPTSPFAALNLADAELLAGRTEHAEELYQKVLELTASDPAGSQWQILTVRAQALAHLDRPTDAVALVQEALQSASENPQAAFEAAVVYSLVGEDRSALVNSRRALRLGVEPVWFEFPWFDDLRDHPEFQTLLQNAGP